MDVFDKTIKFNFSDSDKVRKKTIITSSDAVSLIYAPGIKCVDKEIFILGSDIFSGLKIKKNTVAIVTDGTDIVGLGNIGAQAALPVMETKAALFKEHSDVEAFPICLNTADDHEFVQIIRSVTSVFSAINLGQMQFARSSSISQQMADLNIPVYDDLIHGLSVVLLASIINASILSGKKITELKVVIYGENALTYPVVELLLCVGQEKSLCQPVRELVVCDRKGVIFKDREDLQDKSRKSMLARITNKNNIQGHLAEAVIGADIFICLDEVDGISGAMLKHMNIKPAVFIFSGGNNDLLVDESIKAGVFIIGTLKKRFPNWIAESLVSPGILKGALDVKASRIDSKMKMAAAWALAASVPNLSVETILPDVMDKRIALNIADAVRKSYVPIERVHWENN